MQRLAACQASLSYMRQIAQPDGPPRAVVARSTGRHVVVAGAARADDIAERALEVAYRTALGVTRDPQLASDIAQEVAVKALLRTDTIRDPDAFGAWVHRTTVRASIDQYRRARRRRTAEHDFASTAATTHEDDSGHHDALELLAGLPDRQRAAMTLRHVHDLSDRQIAHALGCRTGTARSLLSRATATLRERLMAAPTPKDLG